MKRLRSILPTNYEIDVHERFTISLSDSFRTTADYAATLSWSRNEDEPHEVPDLRCGEFWLSALMHEKRSENLEP